jgi:hypothetical protein
LLIDGKSPLEGRVLVELVRPLGQLGFVPPDRSRYCDEPDALAEYELVYQKANDPRISSAKVPVTAGRFRAVLSLPAELKGKYLVRAFVEGKDGFGSGIVEVRIGKAPDKASSSTTSEKEVTCTPKPHPPTRRPQT